jgi:hypothetical protein
LSVKNNQNSINEYWLALNLVDFIIIRSFILCGVLGAYEQSTLHNTL